MILIVPCEVAELRVMLAQAIVRMAANGETLERATPWKSQIPDL